jgi:hypothetical protein
METTIRIQNRDIQIALHPATVIHTDKYSETSGGWGNLPVVSTLYTDVVFRSRTSKEDWHHKITSRDLPVYNDQEVRVISADNIIIGYIDEQTKKYYYTSNNLSNRMGLGMSYYLVWVIGIVGAVIIGLLTWETTMMWLLFTPLIITWLFYRIQKWVLHAQVTKAIDHYLRDE